MESRGQRTNKGRCVASIKANSPSFISQTPCATGKPPACHDMGEGSLYLQVIPGRKSAALSPSAGTLGPQMASSCACDLALWSRVIREHACRRVVDYTYILWTALTS